MPASDPAPDPTSPATEPADIVRLRAEHAAAVHALQTAIRDTTRLTRLFSILSESAPLDHLLDRVLTTLSELFLADIVVLFDAGDNGLRPLAYIGLPEASALRAKSDAQGRVAVAALTGGLPIVVPDVSVDPGADTYLRELAARTAVWLPVKGEHATRGVLVLARCLDLAFTRADVDLLTTMAYRIGLMLDRAHDEQERQRLESKLRQAEKAESLGRMAAAIAHRFNNMLGAVVASLDLARDALPADHRARYDIATALEAASRAAETNGLMLAYLGQGAGAREQVDLARILRDALPALQSTLPPNVALSHDLTAPDLIILANAPQITQVLKNLVTNAWEAMAVLGGRIHLSVRARPAHAIPAAQRPAGDWKPAADAYAVLEIADTGCGMTPPTIEKIFDPFFTTKFVGRGLGLPVVFGTVSAHLGFVSVESTPNQGTIFRVFLPLVRQLRPAAAPPPPTAPSRSPFQGLVLLADDEEIVRRTVTRVLEKLGFEVVAAADGVEAVEQFRAHQGRVRLAILDLTMPGMDGWAALQEIRTLEPGVPAILASGYDAAHVFGNRQVTPPPLFLHKPYALAELTAAIKKILPDHAATPPATSPKPPVLPPATK